MSGIAVWFTVFVAIMAVFGAVALVVIFVNWLGDRFGLPAFVISLCSAVAAVLATVAALIFGE